METAIPSSLSLVLIKRSRTSKPEILQFHGLLLPGTPDKGNFPGVSSVSELSFRGIFFQPETDPVSQPGGTSGPRYPPSLAESKRFYAPTNSPHLSINDPRHYSKHYTRTMSTGELGIGYSFRMQQIHVDTPNARSGVDSASDNAASPTYSIQNNTSPIRHHPPIPISAASSTATHNKNMKTARSICNDRWCCSARNNGKVFRGKEEKAGEFGWYRVILSRRFSSCWPLPCKFQDGRDLLFLERLGRTPPVSDLI